jgi:hypothetical protein
MRPEDYRPGTDGRLSSASTAGHDCERIRRFTEDHPARILRSHTRTDGYVAWVGDGTNVGVTDALATWFGPPTAA